MTGLFIYNMAHDYINNIKDMIFIMVMYPTGVQITVTLSVVDG